MAGPVVAGTAAFLLSYYPTLSAKQLKYIIEKTATPLIEKVALPGSEENVSLSDISVSGGILNAYEASKLAGELTGERIEKPEINIKPKMSRKRARG
jgi:subtilisin family serine protease